MLLLHYNVRLLTLQVFSYFPFVDLNSCHTLKWLPQKLNIMNNSHHIMVHYFHSMPSSRCYLAFCLNPFNVYSVTNTIFV